MKAKLYKTYLSIFFGSILLLLTIVMIFNYYLDPGNVFYNSHSVETEIANYLLKQKEVMIGFNYNDRSMQKFMLNQLISRPSILILGSSHSMPIHQGLFKKSKIYNASVPSATLEDDMALYYVYQKRGWQPDGVLICLDPWILDNDFTKFRMLKSWKNQWKITLFSEYYEAKKLILGEDKRDTYYWENISNLLSRYHDLVSFDYFIAAIKQSKFFLRKDNKIIISSNRDQCLFCKIILPDGAHIPSQNEETLSINEIKSSALGEIEYLQDSFRNYHDFDQHNSEYVFQFERFIQYLKMKKVTIIFYFPSLEPHAYNELTKMKANKQAINAAEDYFTMLAKKYNIKIVGSYNPNKLELEANDFIDGWHLKAKGINKIFQSSFFYLS